MDFIKTVKKLTHEDKISLRYWITFVEKNGIIAAQENFSFKDYKLTGEWLGFRSTTHNYKR